MKIPTQQKLHFSLIFAAQALGALCVLGVLASGPQLMSELSLSALQVGGLASAYSATLAAASFPAGVLTDKIGTRHSLTLSAWVMAMGMLGVGLGQSYLHLCIGMAICGAGYGMINPAAGRAISLWFSPDWRGTLIGLKQTGVPVGGAIGTGLAGLGIVYGWQLGVILIAIIAACLGSLFWLFLPKNEGRSPALSQGLSSQPIRNVLKTPHLSRANLASGLTNGGQFTLWAFLAEVLRQSATLSASLITLCMGLLQLGTLIGRLFWGVMNDRTFGKDPAKTLQWICAVAFFGALLLILQAELQLWALAPIAALLLGFSTCSATGLHITLTLALAPPSYTGTAIGYTMLVTNLGGVIAPLIFGLVFDLAGTWGFALLMASMMLLAIGLLRFDQAEK